MYTLASKGESTPRTQKVTSRVRGVVGVVVRPAIVRRRWPRGHRNAVADHDRVVVDEDFLDDEAHDSLPLHDVECLGRCAQAREKRRQGLGQAQRRPAGDPVPVGSAPVLQDEAGLARSTGPEVLGFNELA